VSYMIHGGAAAVFFIGYNIYSICMTMALHSLYIPIVRPKLEGRAQDQDTSSTVPETTPALPTTLASSKRQQCARTFRIKEVACAMGVISITVSPIFCFVVLNATTDDIYTAPGAIYRGNIISVHQVLVLLKYTFHSHD
jgi:hypothetical protein